MFEELKRRAVMLKNEVFTLFLASKDKRTPLYAKIFLFFVVGYAFSPLDLIPDFIPVLGYLDDILILPVGIYVAVKLIPREVLVDARTQASSGQEKPTKSSAIMTLVIACIWAIILLGAMVVLVDALGWWAN